MSYTYVLYSKSLDRYYIGACHKDLGQRIDDHNTGKYGSKAFTAGTNDWVLFLKFDCNDYSHAVRLERKIKAMKSSVYIRNLGKYPDLRLKILEATKSARLS